MRLEFLKWAEFSAGCLPNKTNQKLCGVGIAVKGFSMQAMMERQQDTIPAPNEGLRASTVRQHDDFPPGSRYGKVYQYVKYLSSIMR
jgi:hypothetical protein